MRTTIRLDDNFLRQVKREAQRRGETITSMIEQGLRLVLASSQSRPHRKRVKIPISREGGGVAPGVDLNDSAALLDLMEGRQ
ncbi:MAG: type II toxin-antitoxin system VapB family antitoxin [Terriglobia bacterium]